MNPFKNVRDTFEAIAVEAGENSGNLDEFNSKIDSYVEKVKSLSVGSSKEATAEVFTELENAFEYAIDFCNDLRVNIKKIAVTAGQAESFRESFLEVILSYNNLPRGYRIDESLVNFTPEATGVHFAEYVYDEETGNLDAKLDEDLSHYSVEGIVNTFIPNIVDYYMSGFKISGAIATKVLGYVENQLTQLHKALLDMRDGEGTKEDIAIKFKHHSRAIYERAIELRKVYQVCSNMVKNLDIIESAYTIFFKAENRVMTL